MWALPRPPRRQHAGGAFPVLVGLVSVQVPHEQLFGLVASLPLLGASEIDREGVGLKLCQLALARAAQEPRDPEANPDRDEAIGEVEPPRSNPPAIALVGEVTLDEQVAMGHDGSLAVAVEDDSVAVNPKAQRSKLPWAEEVAVPRDEVEGEPCGRRLFEASITWR